MNGHCLLRVEGFDEIRELFFDQDPLICNHIDTCFCSEYEYIQNLHVIHEECKTCTTIQEMFDKAEPQMLRDWRRGSWHLYCKLLSNFSVITVYLVVY